MSEKLLLNTREILTILSTNSNKFKAFRDKHKIEAIETTGNQEKFDTKRIVKLWLQDATEKHGSRLDKNKEDARYKAANADLKELELAFKKGELLAKSDVESEVSEILVICRNKFLILPEVLTSLVHGVEDRLKVKGIIKKKVYEVLEELARLSEVGKAKSDETPS